MRKGFLIRFNIVLVFIWFFFLVYLSYGKSLGLSLYGDDWLVISKYFGAYGPGRRYPYLHLDLITTNYGPQYIGMAILYKLFGSWALPYYIVSFVTRALCALTIYWFASRLTKNRFAGLAAGSLFAISVVGSQTTDWVYNMNSYVGVGLSLIGLGLFLYADNLKKNFISWFFLIIGYMIVIIRLFILPVVISLLVFSKSLLFSSKRVGVSRVVISLVKLILAVSPFLILKHFFPGLGFQEINAALLANGLQRAQGLVAEWKFDWLLTPFTMVGSYIFPGVFELIKGLGWRMYPVKDFVLYGSLLGLFGTLFLYVMLRSYQKRFVFIFSFFISFLLLFLLKLYFHYQGPSLLKEFDKFSQTFVGIIFFFGLVFSIWRSWKRKNLGLFSLNLVGFFYIFSMLFPWSYNPGSISLASHRYNIVPSVGLFLILGNVFAMNKLYRKRFGDIIAVSLFSLIVFSQIFSTNKFFARQLSIRPAHLNDQLFGDLKKLLPELPTNRESVFYFEAPGVFGQVLGFGFPFHMQLVYDLEPNFQKYPYSVGRMKDLVSAVSDLTYVRRMGYRLVEDPTPVSNVFAFKVKDEHLVDVTEQTRMYLQEILKEK